MFKIKNILLPIIVFVCSLIIIHFAFFDKNWVYTIITTVAIFVLVELLTYVLSRKNKEKLTTKQKIFIPIFIVIIIFIVYFFTSGAVDEFTKGFNEGWTKTDKIIKEEKLKQERELLKQSNNK